MTSLCQVVSKAFDGIRSLFESRPSRFSLPVDMCGRMLTALYAYRPSDPASTILTTTPTIAATAGFTGYDTLLAWIRAVQSGCAFLCELALTQGDGGETRVMAPGDITLYRLVGEHLDRFVKNLLDLFATTTLPKLRKSVAGVLDDVFINQMVGSSSYVVN